jgi:hypothetical protein
MLEQASMPLTTHLFSDIHFMLRAIHLTREYLGPSHGLPLGMAPCLLTCSVLHADVGPVRCESARSTCTGA